MKYDWESEEEFEKRRKEAKKQGICIFRNDDDRELILDLIDGFVDVIDVVSIHRGVAKLVEGT